MVELPRVQLRFVPGPDPFGRGLRLFSKEFGGGIQTRALGEAVDFNSGDTAVIIGSVLVGEAEAS